MAVTAPQLKRHSQDFEPLGGLPRSQYGPKEGWLTFIIVLLLALSVVWSVETAHWLDGMPSYSITTVVGVIAGMALAKVKRRALFLHPISALLAYVMLVWQTRYLTADGWFIAKTGDMVSRSRTWVAAAGEGGISADPLPFVIIVFIFTWIVTYLASWFVFRSLRFWPAVIPAGLALFLNLLYLPEKFWVFFYLFIVMVVLLSMRMYFLRKRAAWDRREVPYIRGISPAFGFTTVLLAGVIILSVVLIPRTDFGPDVMKRGWGVLSIPWKAMETELGRVLSFLPGPEALHHPQIRRRLPVPGREQAGRSHGDADLRRPTRLLARRDLRRLHPQGLANRRPLRAGRGVPAPGRGDIRLRRHGADLAVGGDGRELGRDIRRVEPSPRHPRVRGGDRAAHDLRDRSLRGPPTSRCSPRTFSRWPGTFAPPPRPGR